MRANHSCISWVVSYHVFPCEHFEYSDGRQSTYIFVTVKITVRTVHFSTHILYLGKVSDHFATQYKP